MNRTSLYWSVNLGFLCVLGLGSALGSAGSVHLVYLVLLFAICATPILNVTAFNDRYALLALFSLIFFQFYGTLDVITLFRGVGSVDGILSEAEAVILVGGAISQIGYRLMARRSSSETGRAIGDWPEHTLLFAGCAMWVIATYFSWQFKVNVLTETTAAATQRGLASISGLQTIGYLLAVMVQPLSILILAYLHTRYNRSYLAPLIIGVVLVQLVLGFVIDVKGEALIGAILVAVTYLLVRGRIPKAWLVGIALFIALAFPAMQANRMIRSQYRIDHAEAAQNLLDTVKLAFSKSEEVTEGSNRSETVFERLSLKGSVTMIVQRTGSEVPFQSGYTLTPIYAAFIPKIVWPNKPEVQTGQLMNREFRVSASAYTYISPSHLGEMYWNFSWPGVVIGTLLASMLLGFIGKHVDMTHHQSITRLMIAAVSIKYLIQGYEGTIAVAYVVWLRSMLAIGILHLLLSKRATAAGAASDQQDGEPDPSGLQELVQSPPNHQLPNLLR